MNFFSFYELIKETGKEETMAQEGYKVNDDI
jgi:hypothetical protein